MKGAVMNSRSTLPLVTAILASICLQLQAGDLSILAPLQRKPVFAGKDRSVEKLAKEIDWLESVIDCYGTIVPKQPDIWGEARLTRHRHQVEEQLFKDIDTFRETLNASLRRSDQSFLSVALSLSSAVGEGTLDQAESQLNNVISLSQPTGTPISQTAPGQLPAPRVVASQTGEEIKGISLEPTVVIQQKYRYLQLLSELRRLNEGDDIADSPGYSLNVVRIPVSILPGKMTRKGFGAEITFTAQSQFTRELLPTTFRTLVINDLVEMLAFPGRKILDHPELVQALKDDRRKAIRRRASRAGGTLKPWDGDKNDTNLMADALRAGVLDFSGTLVTATSSRPLLPFPPAHMADIFGLRTVFSAIVIDGVSVLKNNPVNADYGHLPDVEAFLRGELHAAYDFLSQPETQLLWQKYCTPTLVAAIRGRKRYVADELYEAILPQVGVADSMIPDIKSIRDEFFDDLVTVSPRTAYSATASLAWGIIVDAALLNDRLMQDMRSVAAEKECPWMETMPPWPDFYLPQPSPASRNHFNAYVQCRWPTKVFALDPHNDEQNVQDVFSMRREMQLAVAAALASGNISAGAAGRFMRRLELDLETISLNPKVVGFAHGNDTFGWRFAPRVQTPPPVSNAQALWQSISGGPNRDWLLNQRELEPGIRELTAVVLMPSFVPHLVLESRANWFRLTNPKHKELTLRDAMHVSRSWQCVSSHHANLCNTACYRPEDISLLGKAVQQLERDLPLQSMRVPVPYDNTLGGFEMFNSGVTDLAPSLRGWYGAPGVNVKANSDTVESDKTSACKQPCDGTTIFLVGKNFSVHDTKVIAGGRQAPFTLISREILQITVPYGVNVLKDKSNREFIDVHVATPYGISNHLLVRTTAAPKKEEKPKETGLAWKVSEYQARAIPNLMPPNAYVIEMPGDLEKNLIQNRDATPTPSNAMLSAIVYANNKDKPIAQSDLFAMYLDNRELKIADGSAFVGAIREIAENHFKLADKLEWIKIATFIHVDGQPTQKVKNTIEIKLTSIPCAVETLPQQESTSYFKLPMDR